MIYQEIDEVKPFTLEGEDDNNGDSDKDNGDAKNGDDDKEGDDGESKTG